MKQIIRCEKIPQSEFRARFGTEELCQQYLYKHKWPNGFVCPKCGSTEYYSLVCGRIQCKECSYQASVTSGTIMHNSHAPLTKWFEAMYMVAQSDNKITAVRVKETLHVTYKTAWYLLSRIRSATGQESITYLNAGQVEFNDALFRTLSQEKTDKVSNLLS